MATYNKYRLYCETESAYKYPCSASEPTDCPTDAGHTVRSGSLCCVEENVANPSPTLADNKAAKIVAIDARTVELIDEGFTYDSQTFSLSEPAQTNWIGIKSASALLTWPVSITTKDDGEYSLAEANLDAFFGAGLGTKQAYLDSGRTLKVSVTAATTQAELDAVVDTR